MIPWSRELRRLVGPHGSHPKTTSSDVASRASNQSMPLCSGGACVESRREAHSTFACQLHGPNGLVRPGCTNAWCGVGRRCLTGAFCASPWSLITKVKSRRYPWSERPHWACSSRRQVLRYLRSQNEELVNAPRPFRDVGGARVPCTIDHGIGRSRGPTIEWLDGLVRARQSTELPIESVAREALLLLSPWNDPVGP